MKQQLYNKFNPTKPNYIDLAIDTHVLVPTDLATQIGIFNGTKGTVVGFGFTGTAPEDTLPDSKSFHLLPNREIPIVFVRMDIDIGYSVDKEKNALPFTMMKDDGKILKKYHRWYMPLLQSPRNYGTSRCCSIPDSRSNICDGIGVCHVHTTNYVR
jgi:hypothetical protein